MSENEYIIHGGAHVLRKGEKKFPQLGTKELPRTKVLSSFVAAPAARARA